MSYGNLGQPRSGHLRSTSKNPKSERGSTPPKQTQRGFGGAPSRNTTNRGRPNGEGQHVRGYPMKKSSRRSGGKGR